MYIAAEAHGAKQLCALCEYWMAREPEVAEKHEQWKQVNDEVKRRVHAEHDKLVEERAKRRKEREQLARMPCVLAPIVEDEH